MPIYLADSETCCTFAVANLKIKRTMKKRINLYVLTYLCDPAEDESWVDIIGTFSDKEYARMIVNYR